MVRVRVSWTPTRRIWAPRNEITHLARFRGGWSHRCQSRYQFAAIPAAVSTRRGRCTSALRDQSRVRRSSFSQLPIALIRTILIVIGSKQLPVISTSSVVVIGACVVRIFELLWTFKCAELVIDDSTACLGDYFLQLSHFKPVNKKFLGNPSWPNFSKSCGGW